MVQEAPDEAGQAARAAFPAFGTEAVILVADRRAAGTARQAVETVIDQVDRACSRFRDDSEITALNRANGRPMPASATFLDALEVALRAAHLTGGAVDPTVGQALRLIGYDRDFAEIAPDDPRPVARVEPVAGWQVIAIDRRSGTVRVPAGVAVDLGATAKAWAADQAAERAAAAAGCGVLVSFGGDLAVAGPAPAGGWPVRVAEAHNAPDSAPSETVAVSSGGLATSSTTVRRWRRGGQDMHHVIDPSTGRAAPAYWRAVTVAAGTCTDANVATTAAIIHGEAALEWLSTLGLPARLVRHDGRIFRLGQWPTPASEARR